MKFEDSINGFLVSQMLGDGHIVNKTSLVISHSDKQEEYLRWKREIGLELGLACSTPTYRTIQGTFGRQTLCTFCVSGLKDRLVKLLDLRPCELIQSLTPLGLLCWWMDDGCLSVSEKSSGSVSRFGYLCTEGFSFEENQTISDELYRVFRIETRLHRDKHYYRLYLNATNLRRMIDIFRDELNGVPLNMLYKVNMDYRPNRISSSLLYSKLYNF